MIKRAIIATIASYTSQVGLLLIFTTRYIILIVRAIIIKDRDATNIPVVQLAAVSGAFQKSKKLPRGRDGLLALIHSFDYYNS